MKFWPTFFLRAWALIIEKWMNLPTYAAVASTIGIYFSIFLAGALFLLGLIEVAIGAFGLTRHLFFPGWDNRFLKGGLGDVLQGLELLFLAPAAAITFASSVAFLKAKVDSILRAIGAGSEDLSRLERSRVIASEMHEMKLSFTGLMIGVVLTDLIGRVLSEQSLELQPLAARVLAATLCLVYYLVLTLTHSDWKTKTAVPDASDTSPH